MATAAAIDRLVHYSVLLEFDVPSYRTEAGEAPGQRRRPAARRPPRDPARARRGRGRCRTRGRTDRAHRSLENRRRFSTATTALPLADH